ncbi:MAG: DUF1028 domain-containing protein [Gammaproteobacteria bacterium]|nr:DUF1028 domain-containing protein [Gammaproteobacteria bacterium]
MTLTVMARCKDTGRLGIATTTRSLAVGARVPHVRSGKGVVAIMAIADQRLGKTALGLLDAGYKAPGVVSQLVIADPNHEYRQLGVIDADGFAAARTGQHNRDWAGHHVRDGFIALGNVLVGEHVLDAMEAGFNRSPTADLEERLMQGLEAGRDAGGQHGGQNSAAILVHADRDYPLIDLRVDIHDEPVAELRRVFDLFMSARDYYWQRQVDPTVKPLFEVVPDRGF